MPRKYDPTGPEAGQSKGEVRHAARADFVLRQLTVGSVACCRTVAYRAWSLLSLRKWERVDFLGEGSDVTIDVSDDMNRKQLSSYGSWTFSKNGHAYRARFVSQ
jgi:hypothetical protein